MKEVYNQNLGNFGLAGRESMNVPVRIFIGFQKARENIRRN